MPWLRLDATFARHRKIRRLSELLGLPIYAARGLVAGLFCKVCAEQPDGILDDWTAADIAWACDWDGDPIELRSALTEVRFVIEGDESTEINDWMEYAAGYREAERARKYRERKKSDPPNKSVTDSYVTRHVRVPDPSVTRHADRTGPDRTRPDQNNYVSPADADDGSVSNRKSEIIQEIWDHYRSHHPGTAKVLKSDRKEYRLLKARLEDFDAGTLKRAIDGYHKSEWHQGNNDRGKKYLSFELMMRDISHVQAGLGYLDEKPRMPESYLARPDMTDYDPLAKYRDKDGNI